MKTIAVLLNYLHHFHYRIKCDKTHNAVHGQAFEVQHDQFAWKMSVAGEFYFKRHTKAIMSNVCQICVKFHQHVTEAVFLQWCTFL